MAANRDHLLGASNNHLLGASNESFGVSGRNGERKTERKKTKKNTLDFYSRVLRQV